VVGQRERRLLAAAVGPPIGLAELLALRRVDPEEADALAVDLDRVAVDDGRPAGQVDSAGGHRGDQDGDKGKNGLDCVPGDGRSGGYCWIDSGQRDTADIVIAAALPRQL
jgi:hypothetical protein